jgi:hypothetical protein
VSGIAEFETVPLKIASQFRVSGPRDEQHECGRHDVMNKAGAGYRRRQHAPTNMRSPLKNQHARSPPRKQGRRGQSVDTASDYQVIEAQSDLQELIEIICHQSTRERVGSNKTSSGHVASESTRQEHALQRGRANNVWSLMLFTGPALKPSSSQCKS